MSGTHVLAYAFWCAACLMLYTYAGYPLWIYLRSRLHPRPPRQEPMLPRVSIILAVHNGAALLRQKIDHLLSLDYPRDRMEIVIVSDGSTDGTDDILKEFTDPRLQGHPMFRASWQGGSSKSGNAERHRRNPIIL